MKRLVLGTLALVEVVLAERIVARGERFAFDNPHAARLQGWTIPMARLEGIVALWVAWKWESAWPGIRPLFGAVGLPMLLAPTAVLDAALGIAYENPDEIEVKPWVGPLTRLLGLCYVLVAIAPVLDDSDTHDKLAADGSVVDTSA
ncbi:hypothetical protein OB905_05410 [Halobacteria archaeon AArc-dxtr1]|nr:hypothetical protein [Halobacteria archaeon AArc-dxtr1]